MNRQAVKDVLYGGLAELANNKIFYYNSSIGKTYSHWTDEGEAAVKNFLLLMTPILKEAEESALDQRARNMVMKELKS
jgi:hypothetical protein